MTETYDVIIVGAGIAGLTSAAYLTRAGFSVLVVEKNKTVGGLVNSYTKKGFTFDGGIRAFENAGIVFPMFKELGLELETVANPITVGIDQRFVTFQNEASLLEYQQLLMDAFPQEKVAIQAIIKTMQDVMKSMSVLYGIDNPLFMNLNDKRYLLKTLLPWYLQYKKQMKTLNKLNEPVEQYLNKLTKNQALIDIIIQHFFTQTPTFFALSYFYLYLAYHYPIKGMGALPKMLEQFIIDHQGKIELQKTIIKIDVTHRQVSTRKESYSYHHLIWAADMKSLYDGIDLPSISSAKLMQTILDKRRQTLESPTNESILTIYYALAIPPSTIAKKGGPHSFYTPSIKGLSHPILGAWKPIVEAKMDEEKEKYELKRWLRLFFSLTTYEISCPALRNQQLAPSQQSGLIVSTLFDYALTRHIEKQGWYEEFKTYVENEISLVLEKQLYPQFRKNILFVESATPRTIKALIGSKKGAITGWQYRKKDSPCVQQLTAITKAIQTPLPSVYQAGQWTFAPSGLPTCILTGKLAAKAIMKSKKIKKEGND